MKLIHFYIHTLHLYGTQCLLANMKDARFDSKYDIPGTRARHGARWSYVSDPRECVSKTNDECRSVGASWRHGARQRGEEARHIAPYILDKSGHHARRRAWFLGIGEGNRHTSRHSSTRAPD